MTSRETSGRVAWLLLPAIAITLPLVAALVLIGRISFDSWTPETGVVRDFTLANYIDFFSDDYNYRVLGVTFRVSLMVTVGALLLGYPLAYLLATTRYKKVVLLIIVIPLLMDILVRAYGWVVLLSGSGLVNQTLLAVGIVSRPVRFIGNESAVVMELLHEVLPLMVLPIARVLEQISPNVTEAARGLGAGPVSVFRRVILPLSMPGVVAGTLLTFGIAMSAFAAPLILGAGRVRMISLSITQQMTALLDWPAGAAQSVILLVIVTLLMIGYARAAQAGGAR